METFSEKIERFFNEADIGSTIDLVNVKIADEAEYLVRIIYYLFDCLDDIDTSFDVAKDDTEYLIKVITELHRNRFKVCETDGISLSIKDGIDFNYLQDKNKIMSTFMPKIISWKKYDKDKNLISESNP